jgi:hypothetical protein
MIEFLFSMLIAYLYVGAAFAFGGFLITFTKDFQDFVAKEFPEQPETTPWDQVLMSGLLGLVWPYLVVLVLDRLFGGSK